MNLPEINLTMGHIEKLESYDWPGNCRELQNIIERAAITSRGQRLNLEIPSDPKSQEKEVNEKFLLSNSKIFTEDELLKLQKDNTIKALEHCQWKVYGAGGAAELLGIKPTTLNTRIKKMQIRK